MSHPHPRQQQGSNDMQWKQHLIAKQMQEIQRHQRFQQLHLGTRQHNNLNQIYGAAGQSATAELPSMLSGMPIAHAMNYMPGELFGGESNSSSSSHRLIAGNMNWGHQQMPVAQGFLNGLMHPNDPDQSINSMGYAPQQQDQSLHGTPVSAGMVSLNQYLQLQGSHGSTRVEMMPKLGNDHAERTAMQLFAINHLHNGSGALMNEGYSNSTAVAGRQGVLGKQLFGNAFVQATNHTAVAESINQSNGLMENAHVQQFQHVNEQTDWLRKSHESMVTHVAASHGATSLDPTEEKLLFGIEDDGNWNVSVGGSCNGIISSYLDVCSKQNNDCFSVCPSIQGGTWSALVQEALDVSSSDTGQQEEWSGLSMQKEERARPLSGLLSDDGRPNALRDGGNQHNVSSFTTKAFSLSSDANVNQSNYSVPGYHQTNKFPYEQNERLASDHSTQPIQKIPSETQSTMQQNAPSDVWSAHAHQQDMHPSHGTQMGFNSQEAQSSWIHQHKFPLYHNSESSNKLNGWGINSPSHSGIHSFKNHDKGDVSQYAQSCDENASMHVEMIPYKSMGRIGETKDFVSLNTHGGPEMIKSGTNNPKLPSEIPYVANYADIMSPNSFRSNTMTDQQAMSSHSADTAKHSAVHMLLNNKEANQVSFHKKLNTFSQEWDLSMSCTNKESGEMLNSSFSDFHHSYNPNNDRNERDFSLSNVNDQLSLVSNGQNLSERSDQQHFGSMRFQFHPMGNQEGNIEPANQEYFKLDSQGISHAMIGGLKNQERENSGNSQFVGRACSANSDMGKECSIRSQKDATISDVQHTNPFLGRNPPVHSFNATMTHFLQDNRIGFHGQNLPMHFHKVDQSDVSGSAIKQSVSDKGSPSGVPEGVTSDGSTSHLQYSQSHPLHGSGLKLAPPTQRQSALGHSLTMFSLQRGNSFTPRNIESVAEAANQTFSSSATSALALPTMLEASQRENIDKGLFGAPQTGNEILHSNIQGNLLGVITKNRNDSAIQQQQQQKQGMSYESMLAQFEQSVNHSFGIRAEVDGHLKHLTSEIQDSHDRSPTEQTSHKSVHAVPSKIPASRLSSFTENGATLTSQQSAQGNTHSEMISASLNQKNTNQQHPVLQARSTGQPFASAVVPQQAGFSNNFNDLWKNASSQWPSGLQSQKFSPNFQQSVNSLQLLQKVDNPSTKGGNASSEVGMCSINSQQLTYGEENPPKDKLSGRKPIMDMELSSRVGNASQLQERDSTNSSDKISAGSVSPLVPLHQPDDGKMGKHAENHMEKLNLPTFSSSCNDVHKHNYSLLQQFQAMKRADLDSSRVSVKRLKGTDICGDGSAVERAEGDLYICGPNTVFRESDAALQIGNATMLSLSSREGGEKRANVSGVFTGGELVSHSPTAFAGQHELQNNSTSRGSAFSLTGGNECHTINPQMAVTWFDPYGTFKGNQTSDKCETLGVFQRNTKVATHQPFFSKTSKLMDSEATVRKDENVPENSFPAGISADNSSPCTNDHTANERLAPVRKKRKVESPGLLPWHKEVMQSSRSLRSFSMTVNGWARATNRLIEKIEDDLEIMDELTPITRSNRRLVLTTQLIQQLIPPVPAKFLFTNAVASYEKIIYYITKLTLGEVCGLLSTLQSEYCLQLERKSRVSEKDSTSKMTKEEFFSKMVENFIVRSKKLQSISLRLDGCSSIIDARIECQDVERGSIINRFAKFHGRIPTDAIEGPSTSESATRRSLLQRNVNVVPMPRYIPDVTCLSL
ncbi:hypothetical protein HPP92_018903 [Vanilla planifolia]|uniref:Uncharacterized protein n=1 Tax=Vanilla planifolia TaxID=51239 RepID=A0A835UIU8_VANPL|nr:hypothetical protein HPP92_018903 [Vanilla planifolia]